jgi:glycosyltransferase involved in cell wall biosynthesis
MVANGWDGDKTSLRGIKATPEQMFKGAMQSDVIVFQRPDDINRVKVVPLLQAAGKKVVFDNDDTYKPDTGVPTVMESVTGKEKLLELNKNLMDFASQANLVTTTTEFLANEYRQYNKNVVVLPNVVDPDDWSEPLRNKGEKVRIGLVGSVLSNDDWIDLKPALEELNKREDVQLVVFGLPPKAENTKLMQEIYKKELDFWLNLNIEWQPFVSMADYTRTLNGLRLDLMLIPRQESYFNKCKSNIKYLEASMLEIPVLASSFADGPYEELPSHCKVKAGEDWLPKIEKFITRKVWSRGVGKDAKKYVLQNYSIKTKAHLWQKAYENLYR